MTNGSNEKIDRRSNFLSVASRASSHHLVYNRDLLFLLNLSMKIKEHGLALDLGKFLLVRLVCMIGALFSLTLTVQCIHIAAGEILDDPKLATRQEALDVVLQQLRLVGQYAVDACDGDKQSAARILKRVFRLYSKSSFRQFVDVPAEFVRLIEHRAGKASSSIALNSRVLELIQFFAEEATPGDVLNALALGDSMQSYQPELLPILKKILTRGAATGSELSASLLRIKRARLRLGQLSNIGMKSARSPSTDDDPCCNRRVWKSMATGMLAMDK